MLPPDEPTETENEPKENANADEEQPPEKEEPSEPPEDSEDKDDGAEGEEPKDGEVKAEEVKEGAVEPEEKRKRAGGWQRRIERLERENNFLREQQMRAAPPAPAAKPDKDKTPEEKAAEYVDTLVEKRLAAREAEQRQKSVITDFQRRTAEVRAAKEDFDDVVSSADIPVGSALGQVLLTSEHGPDIMYQLAKNPAELARLSALPPFDAAREVGRLEEKLSSSTPSAKPNGTAKRPPAPPTSVRGSTSSTRSLEDLPLSDYKRAYRSGRR